jgi:hypothetical protein
VAATKGRSGSALTVRRRDGTGMGKSDATAERRRREGRTDNCARREREGEREGRAQERQSDEEPVGAASITVSRIAAPPCPSLLLSPVPPVSASPTNLHDVCASATNLHDVCAEQRLPHPHNSSLLLHTSSTAASHLLPTLRSSLTLSATAFFDYNNIIIISAPVTRIHLSLHHETDRFVLSSRRAGIDYNTLCCINAPRQQGR